MAPGAYNKPDKIKTRVIAGHEVILDPDGFLVEFDQWSEEVALVLAREQGMEEIGPEHWQVIRFLRDYYLEYGKAPLGRNIRQGTGLTLLEIENIFAQGLKYGARLLAGIPNPRACL